MKYIIHKLFYNFEKEEKWLNDMSSKGIALSDYSCFRYVFEESANSEYIYRIELLKNLPTHPESIAYIKFLEENGVELVSYYLRWIYLRKKSCDGDFDIYSDIESRLSHYKRILFFWRVLMYSQYAVSLVNLLLVLFYLVGISDANAFPTPNLISGIITCIAGSLFLILILPMKKKIKKLLKEKLIKE